MKPKHIAIIMDGNRRWAKSQNHSILEAYEKGLETLQNTIENCMKLKIKYLTVFGFSTENWNRSKNEISYLMKLFNKFLDKAISQAKDNEVKINFIGDIEVFGKQIKDKIFFLSKSTNKKKKLTLTIAVNYGGQQEILFAVKKYITDLLNKNVKSIKILNDFEKYLFNYNFPKIDLLIRTGGEKRLSNFMLWHLAYTELIFLDQMWP
ncbi:polyprenyl diphosphate synthase, partial [Alphaproteobacteria bacterium]|nr:polyprenyl diphosphate synthase [Alphaproteobacteria bacterium]